MLRACVPCGIHIDVLTEIENRAVFYWKVGWTMVRVVVDEDDLEKPVPFTELAHQLRGPFGPPKGRYHHGHISKEHGQLSLGI